MGCRYRASFIDVVQNRNCTHGVNKARKTRIRTYLRKVEEAIAGGDQSVAKDALKAAQPELMRGVTKGLYHKNTVARKISRLSGRVKAMSA